MRYCYVYAVLLLLLVVNVDASASVTDGDGVLSPKNALRKGAEQQTNDQTEERCPYNAPEMESNDDSFHCFNENDATYGSRCPKTHQERLAEAFRYSSERRSGLDKTQILQFEVSSLFDKSNLIMGQESYELLDKHHIDCLMRDGADEKLMLDLEDKGDLKDTLKKAGIPDEHVTDVYYMSYCPEMDMNSNGKCTKDSKRDSHNSLRYDRGQFESEMRRICDDAEISSFIIKPYVLSMIARRD